MIALVVNTLIIKMQEENYDLLTLEQLQKRLQENDISPIPPTKEACIDVIKRRLQKDRTPSPVFSEEETTPDYVKNFPHFFSSIQQRMDQQDNF